MRKLKITSFDKEGVRGGRSLESVLSELETDGDGEGSVEGENNETTASLGAQNNEEAIEELHICRLSFTSVEKTTALITKSNPVVRAGVVHGTKINSPSRASLRNQ